MLTIKPELQRLNPLAMFRTDPRHMNSNGVAGFSGGFDHGGALSDLTPSARGGSIIDIGTKTGAEQALRAGSIGSEGINRTDSASFANAMLSAIDKVSANANSASELERQAVIDPQSVDIQDITIAQAQASMSLNIARTVLSRLTQAWRDLINLR